MLSGDHALVLERPHEFRIRAAGEDDGGGPAHGTDHGLAHGADREGDRDGLLLTDGVLVEPAYVGLCGTDLHIVAGLHPRARFPVVLGHEIVAVATQGRWAGQAVVVDPTFSCANCAACARGDEHVCQRLGLVGIDRPGGLARTVLVAEAKLHPVPSSLSLTAAALTEPLAVAVHAVERAGHCLGVRAAILGAGPIGLLTAMVARAGGARTVLLIEPVRARREAAERLGFEAAADAGTIGAQDFDVVFDAAGAPAAIRYTTRLARPRGVIVLIGVHAQPAAVDLQTVTFAELTLLGTRVYRSADIDVALGLLADGAFDVTPLISEIVDVNDVPAALGRLERGESLKVLASVR
jgi:(R,R)-butanediol dehydrogenase / meso-butanediol dehydrogenase / diacetyl reductase